MLTVVAVMKAKEGKEKDMEEAIKALVPQVQTEQKTLVYTVHRGRKAPGKFLFYERYPDKDALNVHGATPHFAEFFGKIAPLLDGNPTIEVYEDLAAITPKG
ncbi:MAG TPA: putative quinol monooxygenase [Deltaproteobacteria bacterium]|jgi:quinol monooxygenase YgiN|nr:putative quinol monooxygenase [Pseudomonadota bacterium]HNR52336.1 putative quinol monooxygenase [Deltaproteobacteria bacterium]HOD69431.1 putative quinol monooxygenase [Deltaproteobacteria bacterium]HOE71290.1 putative quinol monooxygenase [Deltaproteobacteria bacterium]HON60359.1 putative quinol monooxygenase [Deltaproteobacteria bacterium]